MRKSVLQMWAEARFCQKASFWAKLCGSSRELRAPSCADTDGGRVRSAAISTEDSCRKPGPVWALLGEALKGRT
jgi:hypothetical protein